MTKIFYGVSKMNKKQLSTGEKLLMILAFSILTVTSFINIVCVFVYIFSKDQALIKLLIIAVITGVLAFVLMAVLIKDRRVCENNKKMGRQEEGNNVEHTIKNTICLLVCCVPFLLFGVAMIYVSIITEISYTSSCTTETEAIVDKVSVDKEIARMSSNRKRYIKSTYMAHYTYELQGELFNDTLITSKSINNGQTIKIRYNPDHPESKYVKGYDDAGNLIPMIFGIIWDGLFLFIMCCIIISCKRKLSQKQGISHC